MVGESSESTDQVKEREGRRRSLGRAFTRFKDAMRRRSSAGLPDARRKSGVEETPVETTAAAATEPAVISTETDGQTPAEDHTITEPAMHVDRNAHAAALEQDLSFCTDAGEKIEVGDADEEVLPTNALRIRITNPRAREICDRYGFTYAGSSIQRTEERRRVEKPIRVRLHWQCHECKAKFGGDKTCASCGHRRCQDCLRSPSKRVKEILGGTAAMEEVEEKAAHASPEKDSVAVPDETDQQTASAPPETEIVDKTKDLPLPEMTTEGMLEKDDEGEDGDVDVTQYHYMIQHRPTAGVRMILRPKTQFIRRTCHECNTTFKPSSRQECTECGHSRCKLCPRDPPKSEKWPEGSPGDADPSEEERHMVATVDRVYRKPRQRVRWTCEQCQTTFRGNDMCTSCGHERCATCTRSPLKKNLGETDAGLLAAVAARLARVNEPLPAAPETAAAA